MFIAILNISSVEAKSLKIGEEYKEKNGEVIRVVSSDEVEIDNGHSINVTLIRPTVAAFT